VSFPIPDVLQDLFNKIFRKEESLYTREETPIQVMYEYGERSYRGVPIKYIDKIIARYASSYGTEIYTSIRDKHGNLLSTRKYLTKERPENLTDSGKLLEEIKQAEDAYDKEILDDPDVSELEKEWYWLRKKRIPIHRPSYHLHQHKHRHNHIESCIDPDDGDPGDGSGGVSGGVTLPGSTPTP
jgi:hypothetical protein